MSVEFHVLLRSSSLPAQEVWQAAIANSGFDVTLDPFDWKTVQGFLPVRLQGRDTGFELHTEGLEPEIVNRFDLAGRADTRVTFRFGGDMDEGLAAMCSAAVLAKCTDGLFVDPQSDDLISAEEAISNARAELPPA